MEPYRVRLLHLNSLIINELVFLMYTNRGFDVYIANEKHRLVAGNALFV